MARVLARRVERRLSYLAYARISNDLIASLSNVESHTMGMRSVSGKSNLLGMERSALNAWLDGNCLPTSGRQGTTPQFLDTGEDMRSLLGEEVLKRFALEDVLNCDQVDSFNKGEFDFFALPSAKYAADLSSSTKSISKNSLLFRKLFTKGVDRDPGLITTFLTSVLISFSKNNFICLS